MPYDRNWRDGYRADRDFDYGSDTGAGRDYTYSSARDYEAAGLYGRDGRGGSRRDAYGSGGGYFQDHRDRGPYGARDDGDGRYGERGQEGRYGRPPSGRSVGGYQGAYAHDGRPFEDVGRYRHASDDEYRGGGRQGYGRQPQGYQYEERGFFDRAGDEVRSWFGDEEAERRRDADQRHDERHGRSRYGAHHDDDYHSWRAGQIAALDRDYDEYRRENRSRFNSEFGAWRTGRQGQRALLAKVTEHQEVVGSDQEHVGTVDKVKGDHILLTKNDKDAGGKHHSIPSGWIASVDDKVVLNKTAAEAKRHWEEEDNNSAFSAYGDNTRTDRGEEGTRRGLNRSFSGTY